MDTLSVVSTYTSATDAKALLNGQNGGCDHGYNEGKQGRDTERDSTKHSQEEQIRKDEGESQGRQENNTSGDKGESDKKAKGNRESEARRRRGE